MDVDTASESDDEDSESDLLFAANCGRLRLVNLLKTVQM